MHDNYP